MKSPEAAAAALVGAAMAEEAKMATRPAAKVVKETILTVVEGWLFVSGEGEL